jgi:inosine/xanthosine triphosphate pyrophosphatase family protein
LFFENWRKYLEVEPGGLINYFLKRSAQRRMSTEKLFKILKKVQDFKSLFHTIFFKSASGMKLKSPKKHKKMRSIK